MVAGGHFDQKLCFYILQDLALVDLDDYKYSGANITAMRLIDPQRPQVIKVTTEWAYLAENGQASPLLGKKYPEVILEVHRQLTSNIMAHNTRF